MFKKLMITLLTYLPVSTFGAEFEFSLGSGYQYSGVIGTQFSIKLDKSKYFISLGLPGYSLGAQTIILDNEYHSAGFSLGEIKGLYGDDRRYGFLTYIYHVDGFKSSGWVLGAGLGAYDVEAYTPLFGSKQLNPSIKPMFTLDIGYKF